MSHENNEHCLGCKACARLNITDDAQVQLIHLLTSNLLELQQLCFAAEQINFDLLAGENEDAIEDVIAEAIGNQPPSSTTHH